MKPYSVIRLKRLVALLGESAAGSLLSSFSCPKNEDIEGFLKHQAIPFSKQNIANTYLVFAEAVSGGFSLVGYFSLA